MHFGQLLAILLAELTKKCWLSGGIIPKKGLFQVYKL